MSIKFGVVVFPGSNCDHDAYYALKKVLGYDVTFLWHKDKDLQNSDVIVLPGGFSYGDYLRTGAIARFSPIMEKVISFAENGGIVIGICNGFQILLESGLLPGAMVKNDSLKFICKDVYLKVENYNTIFSGGIKKSVIKIPIAHGDGNYYADEETLAALINNNQVVFKYASNDGNTSDEYNANGSLMNIAGIINRRGNVLGMMPHPERACDPILRKTDGTMIFRSIAESLALKNRDISRKYKSLIKRFKMFGNLGTGEIILIIIAILILFGAKKIPELAQGIGKGMKEFKRALKDVEDDIKDSGNKSDKSTK